jgi:hydroxymethylglutaryl-CoA lyase
MLITSYFAISEEAVTYPQVNYLGFPLSLSETFQQRNTHKSIEQALETVRNIKIACDQHQKELVIYLSMGFGNPYGDPYTTDVIHEFVGKMKNINVNIISLADTIGAADPNTILKVFNSIIPENPDIEFGAHLHSTREQAHEKIEAAYEGGCRRFDGAIKGFGGCPMAKDELMGNIPTEVIIEFLGSKGISTGIDLEKFQDAMDRSGKIFG